jgi:NAD(P)H-hydrate epimerase
VVDIGFPDDLIEESPAVAEVLTGDEVRAMVPARDPESHKGTFGRALVIAGSVGMTGAAALASESALRAGAGLVYLALPRSLNDILEGKCTEVITRPLPETEARSLAAAARDEILTLAADCDAVILGPGISQVPETQALIRDVVTAMAAPLVLDADGLNALGGDLSILKGRTAPTIITPHPGEMSRLLGMPIADIQADRLAAARRCAEESGSVVVLKGARTVVCMAGRPPWINPTGNPGMATAGTGDVLTGLIGGLLAQGLTPEDAACAGVFLHGLAGDLAAEDLTEPAMIAGDVLAWVPAAWRVLLEDEDTEWA